MEMSFAEYMMYINDMLKEDAIREAVNSLKPLGKFTMSDKGLWEPVHYAGYTLITPTSINDCDNSHSYSVLLDVKKGLSEHINFSKCVEAPNNALHMTVARLISGEAFESTIKGINESKFLNYLKVLFSKLAISGQLKFEIKGISVFTQGVIAAVVSPVHKDDYLCLQDFRDYIYTDKKIKEFGVERKRNFNGHITLFYIEKELNIEEKKKLSDAIIETNKNIITKNLHFFLSRVEVRRFNNFLSFDREEDWAVFEFI